MLRVSQLGANWLATASAMSGKSAIHSSRRLVPGSRLVGSDLRAWHRLWTDFGQLRSEGQCANDGLGFGFVLFEPAGDVEHFGDVVAGAAADAVGFLGDANENGVDVQEF
jgi:hypothetical protein